MDSKKHRVVFHPEIPQEYVDAVRNELFPNLNLDAYDGRARDTVKFTFDNIARKVVYYRTRDPNFGEADVKDHTGKPLIDVLIDTGLARSRNDARRLCEQGGIRANGERITNLNTELAGDILLQVGKKRREHVRM